MHNLGLTAALKTWIYARHTILVGSIVKAFSNGAFWSYVCFPYVECPNSSDNSWGIEVLVAEELFYFPYPFQLPESFLRSVSKNDLRLKVQLMKLLVVSEREKKLDLEEFFKPINVRNDQLLKIKKSIIQLLNELIKNLTTSDITRRIKHTKLTEVLKNLRDLRTLKRQYFWPVFFISQVKSTAKKGNILTLKYYLLASILRVWFDFYQLLSLILTLFLYSLV